MWHARRRRASTTRVVVAVPADALAPVAEVGGVVEEFLVVGPDVEIHGDHASGVDAGGGGVDGELADGDVGPVDTPVADAEDLLRVGRDDQVHVVWSEAKAVKGGLDLVGRVDGEVDGAGALVVVRPLLDRVADSGVVHDRQQFGEVVGEESVLEDLVAFVQRIEPEVLRKVGGLTAELGIAPGSLLVESLDGCWKAANEAEGVTFLSGEGGAAIAGRVVEDLLGGVHVGVFLVGGGPICSARGHPKNRSLPVTSER